MARAKISAASNEVFNDNGSVLLSIAKGEQRHMEITIGWVTNLWGFPIVCKVVEGANDGSGNRPTAVQPNGEVTTLVILDEETQDNKFKIVLPEDMCNNWAVQPTPDKPVFGWIDLEVADTGVGPLKQVWKPLRGLVEVTFSPTEE